jgi:amidase
MQQAGHNVVPWEPYKHPHGVTLVSKIYGADGGADIFQTIQASGEPVVPNILDLVKPDLPKLSMNELWDVHLEKWEYQCEYLAAIRELEEKLGTELDAIVAPVAPTAAVRHDEYRYVGYTSSINLLDFSTVVVPVTFADKTIDAKDEGYTPLNDLDAAVHDDCKFCRPPLPYGPCQPGKKVQYDESLAYVVAKPRAWKMQTN